MRSGTEAGERCVAAQLPDDLMNSIDSFYAAIENDDIETRAVCSGYGTARSSATSTDIGSRRPCRQLPLTQEHARLW